MSKLTLAQIQETADQQFGDFTIEIPDPTKADPERTTDVAFRFYLRASKEARIKLGAAFRTLAERSAAVNGDEDASEDEKTAQSPTMTDVFKAAFEALAVKPAHYTKLEKALGDDLILWATVMHAYADKYESQSGEASPSENS